MKITIADRWFSRYIRLRSADKNGMAKCITCGVYKQVKYMDCGHYIKRQDTSTRFNEMNCQTQCKRCNKFQQGNDVEFRKYLVEEYGENAVLLLEAQRHKTTKRGAFEIKAIADYYKQKYKELEEIKNLKLW